MTKHFKIVFPEGWEYGGAASNPKLQIVEISEEEANAVIKAQADKIKGLDKRK